MDPEIHVYGSKDPHSWIPKAGSLGLAGTNFLGGKISRPALWLIQVPKLLVNNKKSLTMKLASTLLLISFAIPYVTSVKECTDYQECKERSIRDDGVSCSGRESCEDSSLIKSEDFIECTAWESCNGANLRASGNIYCTSGMSCKYGSIRGRILSCGASGACNYIRNGQEVIVTTLAHCSGYSSCLQNAGFTVGKRLDCNGISSCRDSEIELGIYKFITICYNFRFL